MARTSYKKFTRLSPTPKFWLRPRDVEIITNIADYRFLDTRQIAALHTNGKVTRNLQRRLFYLFNGGYLDRPPQQVALGIIQAALAVEQEKRGESDNLFDVRPQHFIYALGNKGAALLADHRPDLKSRVSWLDKNRAVGYPQLWHTMMISKFRVALLQALKNHKTAELLEWRQGEDVRDYVKIKTESGKYRRIPVNPDGFFIIKEGNEKLPFFLEADRSTMDHRRFLDKMSAYWRWYRERGHEKKFNIRKFRVLTITKTEARKENLRVTTKQADTKKIGSLMFLFACERQYALDNPENLLSPVWQSPVNNSFHHILE